MSSVTVNANGDIRASGFATREAASWTSSDGLIWQRERSRRIQSITPWGNDLIGVPNAGIDAGLSFSQDGERWESLWLGEFLSDDLDWDFAQAAAGGAGIAAVARGFGAGMQVSDSEGFRPLQRRIYVGTGGSGRPADPVGRRRRPSRVSWVRAGVRADMKARTLSFVDADTGDALVTFAFSELEQAEFDVFPFPGPTGQEELLLFSPDGEQWSVQTFDAAGSAYGVVTQVLVTADRVIATVSRSETEPRSPISPALEIWSAPAP